MTIELTRPHPGSTTGRADASPLSRLCDCPVFLPGEPGYDAARAAWQAAVDQRPAAVAVPRSAAEVAEVVRCATAFGLRVAPQGTGHNAGPLAAQDLSDVVLVRTTELTEVTVDAERGAVRVGSGVTWEPVVEAAAEAGCTVLHGSSPDAVALTSALAPWTNGRNYLNFAEARVDVRSGFAADVWLQLTGIRSAYDPEAVFVGNHPVPRLFEVGAPTA